MKWNPPHLQLLIFGAKRYVFFPDQLLQLRDQLLSLGQPLSHFLHSNPSTSRSTVGRARALKEEG